MSLDTNLKPENTLYFQSKKNQQETCKGEMEGESEACRCYAK